MNSINSNFSIKNTSNISSISKAQNTPINSPQIEEETISDSFTLSKSECEYIKHIPSFKQEEKCADFTEISTESACNVTSSLSGSFGTVISSLKDKLFTGVQSIKELINDTFNSLTDKQNTGSNVVIIEHVGDLTNIPDITPDDETLALADAYGAIKFNDNKEEGNLHEVGLKELRYQLDSMKRSKLLQRKPVAESSMTLAQKTALYSYTGNSYVAINKALWSHDEEKINSIKPIIENATEALESLPSYSGKCFRGTSLSGEDLEKYVPGAKMKYAGFTSTSTAFLNKFQGNTEITIDCLKSNSLGKDIHEFSAFPNEKEILFPPDSEFMVISHKEKDGKHFIHLKELPKEN